MNKAIIFLFALVAVASMTTSTVVASGTVLLVTNISLSLKCLFIQPLYFTEGQSSGNSAQGLNKANSDGQAEAPAFSGPSENLRAAPANGPNSWG